MHSKSKILLTTTMALFTLCLLVMLNGCASTKLVDADITGKWVASTEIDGTSAELHIFISTLPEGGFKAHMNIAAMNVYEEPLNLTYKEGTLHFTVGYTGYSFAGVLPDRSTIKGKTTDPEGGVTKMVFTRSE